ncbi:MAG: hypothetical protein QXL17_02880 [Candidatus Thermoplasmatota archaeon]
MVSKAVHDVNNQLLDVKTLKRIHAVAKKTRKWAESYSFRRFPSDLGGMCAIAAAELHTRLKKIGINSTIAVMEDWYSHCFVLYGAYVIDVTATQFGITTPVLVEEHKKMEHKKIQQIETFTDYGFPWRVSRKFTTVEGLKNYQKRSGWPPDQIAN